MPVKIACPKCKTQYQLPDSAIGKAVKCKSCGTTFKSAAPAASKQALTTQKAPSANDLAQFGIDGPIKKQADIFSAPPLNPRSNPLGNYVEDPGFGEVSTFDDDLELADEDCDDGMDAILNNPYASPKSSPKRSGSSGKKYQNNSPYQYKPLGVLGMLASIGIGLSILSLIGMIVAMGFVIADPTGEEISEEDARGLLMAGVSILVALGLFLLTTLFAGICVCMFMYRGMANVNALGATKMTNSPGWCAGGWFVPIVNLYQPYNAMSEIARASIKPRGRAWEKVSTPMLINLWWTFWIVGSIISRVADGMADDMMLWFTGASFLVFGFAGVFLIIAMRGIVKNQNIHAVAAGLK